MRQHSQGRQRIFSHLLQELPRAGAGHHGHPTVAHRQCMCKLVHYTLHLLRRKVQVAGMFAVFNGAFDHLLYRTVQEVHRQIAGHVQVRLHYRSPHGLADVL